jgi:hypothetical protein
MDKGKLIKISIAGALLLVAIILIVYSLGGGDSGVRVDPETGEEVEMPSLNR